MGHFGSYYKFWTYLPSINRYGKLDHHDRLAASPEHASVSGQSSHSFCFLNTDRDHFPPLARGASRA